MKHRILLNASIILSLITSSLPARAQDDPAQKYIDLGQGVHNVKTDENGNLKSLILVGQARISTVLGASKGLLTARKQASLNAQAEYVKWMSQEVRTVSETSDETIISLKGNGEGDGENESRSEEGKSITITKENVQSIASGHIRGMEPLASNKDDESRIFTIILGWTADSSRLAAEARDSNTDGEKAGAAENETSKTKIKTKRTVNDPRGLLD